VCLLGELGVGLNNSNGTSTILARLIPLQCNVIHDFLVFLAYSAGVILLGY
jgi:hypothetical protein